ncbi:MAG: 23S rRNA (guanosine(2251)-2'-O)-methyltransferase RlmB, partial [Muribaculaceae bacterium]|nr:23S rRNA (guanosine(2251)-2'-O)-methyltransferase RlmB [Muribaculaceae bacterium]
MDREDYIYGIRAIIEAIDAGKEIDKIFIKKDLHGDLIAELTERIRQLHIPTQRVPVERINRITRKNHQGVLAMLSAVTYHRLDHLVPQLYEDGVLPFIVVLDGITDVRNFGAIARTCECAGVDAIVIPERGSVSVGGDAIKTSAGALHRVPVCRERSITNAVKFLRDNGYKVVAASEKVDINYTCEDYTTPVAIVMGAEDTGISPDVLEQCDTMVSIPMLGHIGSLN